jgi:hypothetical protein
VSNIRERQPLSRLANSDLIQGFDCLMDGLELDPDQLDQQ